jgi:hypothetical protein
VTGASTRSEHIVTVILVTLRDPTNRRVLDLDRGLAWVSDLLAPGRNHDADGTAHVSEARRDRREERRAL